MEACSDTPRPSCCVSRAANRPRALCLRLVDAACLCLASVSPPARLSLPADFDRVGAFFLECFFLGLLFLAGFWALTMPPSTSNVNSLFLLPGCHTQPHTATHGVHSLAKATAQIARRPRTCPAGSAATGTVEATNLAARLAHLVSHHELCHSPHTMSARHASRWPLRITPRCMLDTHALFYGFPGAGARNKHIMNRGANHCAQGQPQIRQDHQILAHILIHSRSVQHGYAPIPVPETPRKCMSRCAHQRRRPHA